jgi:beta-carotene hydroxylase
MLRHSADRRTLVFLALAAALPIVQWTLTGFNPLLYGLSLFMGITVAVMSHNHNHLSIWKSKPLNLLTSWAISIHYGHPAIGWVPTHNQNHHKYNNKAPEDLSAAPFFFKGNHILSLLIYPTATSIKQTSEIRRYLSDLWRRDRKAYWFAISEYVVFFGFMIAAFLINWRNALLYYLIPQQVALFVIQAFNYLQHVELDHQSAWNHSRNFVSPVLNALLFNNGYHTVHHFKPGVHWSQTPKLHAEHEAKIHPDLKVRSWWAFIFKTFVLGKSARPSDSAIAAKAAA